MMTKGKGYPDHVKNTDKGFGDMLKAGVQGKRSMTGVLRIIPKTNGNLG